jgi:glutamate synthase (NADPH/NADH) large chain/glutamate synthase (ferredoxin)
VLEGLRTTAGLVVETGSAREVHHFAVLAGYGAEAVHPYLAMETLVQMSAGLPGALSADKAIYNYVKAVGKGLSKIMSKMGVSTYMSYCGAQLFEAWNELLKVKQALQDSRWAAIGMALGLAHALTKNEGKGPTEKLAKLREACAHSPWLKRGERLGLYRVP